MFMNMTELPRVMWNFVQKVPFESRNYFISAWKAIKTAEDDVGDRNRDVNTKAVTLGGEKSFHTVFFF